MGFFLLLLSAKNVHNGGLFRASEVFLLESELYNVFSGIFKTSLLGHSDDLSSLVAHCSDALVLAVDLEEGVLVVFSA